MINVSRILKPIREFLTAPVWPREWQQQYHRTPDLWYLQQHSRQNIFIPDDMKLGKPNHKLIEGHEPIHPDCYTSDLYTVFNKDLGTHSFPLPFEKDVDFEYHGWYKPELARIKGECYSLPSGLFWKVLDIHKDNGVQFLRKRVSIMLPWREITFKQGPDAEVWEKIPRISNDCFVTRRAWMYVAVPQYWNNFIGVSLGTRAVPIFEPIIPKVWLDKYYIF